MTEKKQMDKSLLQNVIRVQERISFLKVVFSQRERSKLTFHQEEYRFNENSKWQRSIFFTALNSKKSLYTNNVFAWNNSEALFVFFVLFVLKASNIENAF